MAQNGAQAPEPGILARLSSTITVEESGYGIQVWRTSDRNQDVCITLRADAEEKLLELLLARRDARLAP